MLPPLTGYGTCFCGSGQQVVTDQGCGEGRGGRGRDRGEGSGEGEGKERINGRARPRGTITIPGSRHLRFAWEPRLVLQRVPKPVVRSRAISRAEAHQNLRSP